MVMAAPGVRTFKNEWRTREQRAWSLVLQHGPEESPSCTEQGCPAKAGEVRLIRADSPDRRASGRESNSDQGHPPRWMEWKGQSSPQQSPIRPLAGCSPRSEVESRHEGDDVASPPGLREMTI